MARKRERRAIGLLACSWEAARGKNTLDFKGKSLEQALESAMICRYTEWRGIRTQPQVSGLRLPLHRGH